jgi:hypothetical protein
VTDLVLTRVQCDPDVTIGELHIGTHKIGYVCEDPVREIEGQPVSAWKIKGQTAIPVGRYKIERTYSNRFGHTMPQLMDVPGFEGIRIHPGNGPSDTAGCLLPGLVRRDKGVGESQLAYREVLKWLDAIEKNGDEAFIVIQGPLAQAEAA